MPEAVTQGEKDFSPNFRHEIYPPRNRLQSAAMMALEITSGKSKMPLVAEVLTAEDEDQLLAAERERARLEEEARILAFQQQQAEAQRNNFISQPDWEIAALQAQFNNPAPMPRQMIGDAQYQLEVDRARAGSGFINALVSPSGEVLTPGYDPATDPRALAAEREAVNFQRQQLYGQLLRDGSTAAEAYRFANSRYPDIKSAAGLARMEELTSRRNFQPRAVNAGGVTYDELSQGRFSRRPQPVAVPGRITPAIKAQADGLAQEASLVRRALAKGVKGGLVPLPYSDEEKAKLRDDLQRIESEQQRILSDPSVNPNVDQRGWAAMLPAWEAAGRAPAVMPQSATLAAAATINNNPDAIRAAFRSGKLTREEAEKQLKAIGFE